MPMHFDAKTGIVNRDVTAAKIRETAAGVRWYEDTLSPLLAHMEDAVVIRNMRASGGHPNGCALLWYGVGSEAEAAQATPWTNYLTSELLKVQSAPAPNVAIYTELGDDDITKYVSFNNRSPDPLGAAQRVVSIADFANSLDVLQGQPPVDFQSRTFDHVASMDNRYLSPTVQRRTVESFAAGNGQATELLNQPIPPVWPPDTAVRDLFNLSDADLTATGGQGLPIFRTCCAFAFQMAMMQVSHVVTITNDTFGYDTHNNHASSQKARSASYFPEIGRLLSALKATPSPLDSNVSMFDTTTVVITSELSRAAVAQGGVMQNGDPFDGSGTPHNAWSQVAIFGGPFKRGYGFGATDANLAGIPADFATGALNSGTQPTTQNLAATLLQANGVSPAGWTDAPPITALLGT